MENLLQVPGYRVTELLYCSDRSLVYRALRESDVIAVVIKLLNNEYPSFNELVMFQSQFIIAKNLDSPGIIKPYSLEVYGNSYALVMEDLGGVSLKQFAQGKPIGIDLFLAISNSDIEKYCLFADEPNTWAICYATVGVTAQKSEN